MEQSRQILPNTRAERLAKLAVSKDPVVCKQVARHPNTAPETLKNLFIKFPKEVLENPVIDLLILENPDLFIKFYHCNPNCFSQDKLPQFYLDWAVNFNNSSSILFSLARSKNIPDTISTKLLSNRDRMVRIALACNPYISEKISNIIIQDNNTEVVEALARNTGISSSILNKLSQHENDNIRANVASNQNISWEIMQQLSEDGNERVLCSLLTNPKIPLMLLKKLAERATGKPHHLSIAIDIVCHPNSSLELKDKMYSCYKASKANFDKLPNIDFTALKYATDIEIKRIGWTTDIGIEYLRKTYGKRSRLQLTDEQLKEFWQFLSALPTSQNVIDN